MGFQISKDDKLSDFIDENKYGILTKNNPASKYS